ncbi:MAG: nickel-binding protein [Chloroflexota bacterium]
MPLYLDVHKSIPGAKAADVAAAHQKDVETQGQYGVKYIKYWVDESTGSVYCLVDAPSKEAAERVHREAHGLVADEIHEVIEGS